MRVPLLITFLVLSGLLFYLQAQTTLSAGEAQVSARAQGETPEPIRTFLGSHFSKVQKDRESYGVDHPEFALLFFSEIPNWRDPKANAWLIGYRIGRDGNGNVPINRLAVVDQSGGVADGPAALDVTFDEACAGDSGIAFELARGVWVFAVSSYEGRDAPCDVRIYTLEPKPRQLLRYGAGQSEKLKSWSGTLHFLDVDSDGDTDILLERTSRDFASGTKSHGFFVFTCDPDRKMHGPEKIAETRYRDLIAKYPDAPRLLQRGPPLEVSSKLRRVCFQHTGYEVLAAT